MENPQGIEYDIRVVRMANSTESTNLKWVLGQMKLFERRRVPYQPVNLNLCLGHFDVMIIERVGDSGEPSRNPMHRVIEDYNRKMDLREMLDVNIKPSKTSESSYYYPLYMLMQLDSNKQELQKALDDYWKKQCVYTVVMRLHQGHSKEEKTFRKLLVERLDEVTETDDCPIRAMPWNCGDGYDLEISLDDAPGNASRMVHCVFYDSLELGDVVCILRGNALRALLEVQRWLYECKHVSDAYSYCGINYQAFVQNPTKEFQSLCEIPKKTCLDYVETRFSVRSSDQAWSYLENNLKDDGYFVTGSADALVHYENIAEWKLIENINQLINNGEMYVAFHSVVTRVGLKNHKPLGNRPSTVAKNKPIILDDQLIDWLAKKYRKTNHPDGEIYAYSLEKLVSSLNAMHSNSVTDALSELMYDGIQALLEQLVYYMNSGSWDAAHGEALQVFLDEWTATTNEILHLESQLFQHPELIPVRYYIPAMILQFQRLIVLKAMDAVKELDQNQRYSYVPIMFPKSHSNTTTCAILDPKADIGYTGCSPLRIRIPIHMLYHPYRISLTLCHEIAHYCGDSIRNRKFRNNILLDCMAYYAATQMIDYMGILGDAKQDAIFKKCLPSCKDRMKGHLYDIMPSSLEEGYLEDVIVALKRKMTWQLTSPRLTEDIVKTVLTKFESDAGAQRRICDRIELEGYGKYEELVVFCKIHLSDCLEELLRECFPDMLMILLTDCSFHDYYVCLLNDEYMNLGDREDQWMWDEKYTDRMALVACCINRTKSKWCDPDLVSKSDKLWQRITREKVRNWENESDAPKKWHREYADSERYPFALLGYEAEQIIAYLHSCAENIRSGIVNESGKPIQTVADLRDRIKLMKTDQMDWNHLQKILRESHH